MDPSPLASALPGLVPTAVQTVGIVVEQEQMARDTFRIRLHCPEIAEQILPGQFFMIRAPRRSDPLLGRPFALYDVYQDESGRATGVDFGYIVVGKLTTLMTSWQPGDEVEVWGPLGNGFPTPPGGHLLLVAGGIGQTPFLAVANEALGNRRYGAPPRRLATYPDRVTLCYGVRSAEYLADFDLPGLEVRVSTDDGTHGHHGLVTGLLEEMIAGDGEFAGTVFCCGPEPMMHAVQQITARHRIPCWLSLESPMACGFGACFSCVTKVRLDSGEWDYRRSCVEGPVFDAERLML